MLAADLLQSVINDAATNNLISHPLGHEFGGDYPIIQYADDTLIIMPAVISRLSNLKDLLYTYSISAGLKVNYQKSFMVPINVYEESTQLLATILGCQVGKMPFTYLGLPLGTTKPAVEESMPILTRKEKVSPNFCPMQED